MVNSVDGFFASDSYRFIQTMSDTQWLAIEDLDSFEVHGAKLWVKLDFAIRHGERIYIYDWKTGKVAKENEVQLAIYALYAKQKWDVDLGLIRLFDVYLNQQLPVKVKPTVRLIDSAKGFIEDSIDSMKESCSLLMNGSPPIILTYSNFVNLEILSVFTFHVPK